MSPQEDKRKDFKWVPRRDGTFNEIYANFVNTNWTLFDVSLRFGQLITKDGALNATDFLIEERATVTVAWPEAKVLRDALIGLVAEYEAANGEIKPLKLPADFSVKNKQPTTTQ